MVEAVVYNTDMTYKEAEEYILGLPKTKLDYPFGEDVAVYKVSIGEDWKMFALLSEKKTPVNLSLKCDPNLGKLLREQYESVMEGYHLNKKHWITVLLTDQIEEKDLQALILHSYNLVSGVDEVHPTFMNS